MNRATDLVGWPSGPIYVCPMHRRTLFTIAKGIKYLITSAPTSTLSERECDICLKEMEEYGKSIVTKAYQKGDRPGA